MGGLGMEFEGVGVGFGGLGWRYHELGGGGGWVGDC